MRSAPAVSARSWQVTSSLLAMAAAVALLVVPTVSSQTASADSSGQATASAVTRATLLQSEGRSVLFILAVPVVLTLVPLVVPGRARRVVTVVITALLGVGVLLGLTRIGVFFVPALACLVVAILRGDHSSAARGASADTVPA